MPHNRDLWKRNTRRRPSRAPWHLWTGYRGRQNTSPYTIHGISAAFRRQAWLNRLPPGLYDSVANQIITRTINQDPAFGFNNRIISNANELQQIERNEMGQNDINVSDTSQRRPSAVQALHNRALGLPNNLNKFSRFYK